MIEWLTLPFQFDFMRTAFLTGTLVAVPCALLSCFLVLKGWALMGDAVSHGILPGIVIAYVAGLPLALGAFAAGMACAVTIGFVRDNSRVKQDTAMGVVFSGMFAAGLVMYTSIESSLHLDHILFGNMLGVTPADFRTTAAIAIAVTAIIALRWRDLLLHAFDPAQARVAGLPVGLMHYGLLAMLSATIVATLASTGLLLAIGLVIAPGAIAFLLVRSFGAMLASAVAIAVLAVNGGVFASFHIDSAPAPTVMLAFTILFLLAFAWRTWRDHRTTRMAA